MFLKKSDKPAPLTRDCPSTEPCAPVFCMSSGGGWTGFDASGEGACGAPSSKTNMDGGGSHAGIHNVRPFRHHCVRASMAGEVLTCVLFMETQCSCRTATGPWELQTRGSTQDAGNCTQSELYHHSRLDAIWKAEHICTTLNSTVVQVRKV